MATDAEQHIEGLVIDMSIYGLHLLREDWSPCPLLVRMVHTYFRGIHSSEYPRSEYPRTKR